MRDYCSCAFREGLRFGCKVSGGDCMYMFPNAELCRAIYCEGPKVTGKEKLFTLIGVDKELSDYTESKQCEKIQVYADNKDEALSLAKKYSSLKKLRVLPRIRILSLLNSKTDLINNRVSICDGDMVIVKYDQINENNTGCIISNTEGEEFKVKDIFISSICLAITEQSILIQYKDLDSNWHQKSLPITEELKKV